MRRPGLVLAVWIGCGLGTAWAQAQAQAPAGSETIRVLFLGDQGHHRPAERFEQLQPVLETRGILLEYTEDLGKLTPQNLAQYDAVAIYANIEQITPEAESALLDFVERQGKGLVLLHCASYCFHNSPRYIALVGAQFQRHGMESFDVAVAQPDHPIMRGLKPFRTRDETYVHTKHNPEGRTVLQTRREGDGDEPWTWVRTQGKGRVFYTAYGHDEQTFGNPGFQDLVERGIRWAAGRGQVFDSRPRIAEGLKPFEYTPADLPNYVAGAQWGTIGEPIKEMQKPLPAEESRKHLVLPAGLRAELFASEPLIKAKPIAMAFDHRGRMWLAETVDYPNELQRPGPGRDRIVIYADSDGDLQADKVTVFAEGLSIPTSITFARGGVIVSQAPDMLFLQDTDGDDRADVKQVLFTGFGTDDTHAGPSNLRYGHDGWIYGIIGYAGFAGRVGGEQHSFRQGFFRFRPDGSKLEFLRSTNNNSWGVGLSEEGLVFGSTANGCPSVFLPIPNRYYEAVKGWSPTVLASIADTNRFWPVTDRVRQVDWHGGFTAGAGHALYTARVYPPFYWNKTAFVAEPTGHLVATFTLHPRGSGFVSHNAWNLLASDDEWTAPIIAEVGPDGCVWVVDWYNIIVQHNPTPRGYQTGKGAAYETPLRDKTHGRVYRIVPEDGKIDARLALDPSDAKGLTSALLHPNMFWRMHAQRLLTERGQGDVAPILVAMAGDPSVDAIGLNGGVTHALWTLKNLGLLEGGSALPEARQAVNVGLRHQSPGVRRTAALVIPRDAAGLSEILAAGLLDDPAPQVQLAATLALAEGPVVEAAAAKLADRLLGGKVEGDRWLRDALIAAGAHHAEPFLRAVAAQAAGHAEPASGIVDVVKRVAEHHARLGGDVQAILAGCARGNPKLASAIVQGFDQGWPAGHELALEPAARQAFDKLLEDLATDPDAQAAMVSLARRWGVEGIEAAIARAAESLLAQLDDEKATEAARIAAARRLMTLDPSASGKLLERLTPKTPPSLAVGWIEAIATSAEPATGDALVEAIPGLLPAARGAAIRSLLQRPAWTKALLDGLEQGAVRFDQLELDQRQGLLSHRDKLIADRASALMAKGGGLPDADRQAVIEELSAQVLKGGDATHGKAVFTQHCSKCHRHGGEGGEVGPDLSGMAAHPREELLTHILDPSRSVEGTFVQYNAATNDGRVIQGILAAETRTTIELLDAEGKRQTVLREELDELTATRKSLMPEGFEKQMSASDLRDLLAFLTQRGKFLPLDVAKVATVVTTRGMFYDENSPVERLVFRDWTPKQFNGVPFVLVDPRGSRLRNAIMLFSSNGQLPPKMPRSVELPCHAPAKAIHMLGGVGGWAFPASPKGTTSLIVRLKYADGQIEDHPLINGEHISDYIREVDVPGSKLAFRLRGQQLRYLAIEPKRDAEIAAIELVKGPDDTAPVVMAVTVETR